MATQHWTEEQVKLAFHLYCQLPFGKLHSRNPEIIELASLIGRSPSAVAMKCTNLASLDPAITGSGRKGLDGASSIDRKIWDEFHADWDRLALECSTLLNALRGSAVMEPDPMDEPASDEESHVGETRKALIEARVKQAFFRRTVLSSYQGKCCMTGVAEPRLLLASHIVPWSKDKANRLNPRNGLCLSALHDRAFDKGLITVTSDFRIKVSRQLRRQSKVRLIHEWMLAIEGRQIDLPKKFMPGSDFLARHRDEVFRD